MSIPSFFSKIAFVVSFTAIAFTANAQHEISEHARLAVLMRQLDMLERIAAESQTLSYNQNGRYYFDYLRLHSDMQRIRSGIRDYLTPQRAQPRDPVEISGNYITERADTGKGQP